MSQVIYNDHNNDAVSESSSYINDDINITQQTLIKQKSNAKRNKLKMSIYTIISSLTCLLEYQSRYSAPFESKSSTSWYNNFQEYSTILTMSLSPPTASRLSQSKCVVCYQHVYSSQTTHFTLSETKFRVICLLSWVQLAYQCTCLGINYSGGQAIVTDDYFVRDFTTHSHFTIWAPIYTQCKYLSCRHAKSEHKSNI